MRVLQVAAAQVPILQWGLGSRQRRSAHTSINDAHLDEHGGDGAPPE